MGFNVSYQHAGLNRCGVFLQTARTKGPERKAQSAKQTAEKVNEPWRRISDLVGVNAETRDPSVRKRCVRKLVAWIDRRVSTERAEIEKFELMQANLTGAWGEDVGEWRRVSHGGRSVESLCVQLGMTPAKLTALTKEVLGITAGELLDGFKIRGLRKFLTGQLREAASRMWGDPGSFAARRCLCEADDAPAGRSGAPGKKVVARRASFFAGGTPAPHSRGGFAAGGTPALHKKRSRYFRTRASEFLGLEDWEEERLRVSELLGSLDALREENDFRIAAFAMRLGFETVSKFRAACLNVTGRTLEQLERVLANEIVHYYLAAEDLALRKLSRRDDVLGFQAREIYWGCEKIPDEPFLDRWSAHEAGKPEWLSKMREAFG